MVEQAKAVYELVVQLREAPMTEDDLRTSFWRAIAESTAPPRPPPLQARAASSTAVEPRRKQSPKSANYYEAQLEANFDEKVKAELNKIVREKDAEKQTKRVPAGRFRFRIHQFRYSSFLATIDIYGIGALLDYIGKDASILDELIDSCIPAAFVASVLPGSSGVPINATVLPVVPIFGVDQDVAAPTPAPASQSSSQLGKMEKLLAKAIQVGWLVPLVLTLVVAYVVLSFVSGERDRLKGREESLQRWTAEIEAARQKRVGELELLSSGLLKQLQERALEKEATKSAPAASAPK